MRVEPIKNKEKIRKIINDLKRKNKKRELILLLLGIYTGLRISDILELKVINVKSKNLLSVKETKTGKNKKIELHQELINELKEYCKDKPKDEYLIKSREGINKPISRVQAYRIIKALGKKYRIESNLGCHSLRKTYGYHMYKENDISIVQGALNHSSQANTIRYIGVEEEEINKATRKLNY